MFNPLAVRLYFWTTWVNSCDSWALWPATKAGSPLLPLPRRTLTWFWPRLEVDLSFHPVYLLPISMNNIQTRLSLYGNWPAMMTRMDTQNAFSMDTTTSFLMSLSPLMANSHFPHLGTTHSVCGTSTLAQRPADSLAIPPMSSLSASVPTIGKLSLVPVTGQSNSGILWENANTISRRMVTQNGVC